MQKYTHVHTAITTQAYTNTHMNTLVALVRHEQIHTSTHSGFMQAHIHYTRAQSKAHMHTLKYYIQRYSQAFKNIQTNITHLHSKTY